MVGILLQQVFISAGKCIEFYIGTFLGFCRIVGRGTFYPVSLLWILYMWSYPFSGLFGDYAHWGIGLSYLFRFFRLAVSVCPGRGASVSTVRCSLVWRDHPQAQAGALTDGVNTLHIERENERGREQQNETTREWGTLCLASHKRWTPSTSVLGVWCDCWLVLTGSLERPSASGLELCWSVLDERGVASNFCRSLTDII